MLVRLTLPPLAVLLLLPYVSGATITSSLSTSSLSTSKAIKTSTSTSTSSKVSTTTTTSQTTTSSTSLTSYTASIPSYVASIASSYSMTASASLALPIQTASSADTQSYMVNNWALSYNKITFGASDLSFVPDPSNATTDGSVLQVFYPAGTYSHSSSNVTGGTQFYAQPLDTTSSNSSQGGASALLSYSVYFPSNFSWVQGGKLPGLRGGSSTSGCSGGSQADGTTCFSTRLMWRTSGAGEVYAYVPTSSKLCSETNVICNSDFGTSFGRGEFSFLAGAWNQVTLYVALNNPSTTNNGIIQLWYNGVQAFKFTNVELRSADSLSGIGGIFFSTFFGGDDPTWAPGTNQSTYYKDMVLFSSSQASTSTSAADFTLRLSVPLSVIAVLIASVIGLAH